MDMKGLILTTKNMVKLSFFNFYALAGEHKSSLESGI
jgi:hypothetical protein